MVWLWRFAYPSGEEGGLLIFHMKTTCPRCAKRQAGEGESASCDPSSNHPRKPWHPNIPHPYLQLLSADIHAHTHTEQHSYFLVVFLERQRITLLSTAGMGSILLHFYIHTNCFYIVFTWKFLEKAKNQCTQERNFVFKKFRAKVKKKQDLKELKTGRQTFSSLW
jgi:hypothetical protein